MNFKVIFLLISIIFTFAFGIFVYFKKRRNPVNLWYGIFVSFVILWSLGLLMMHISDTPEKGLFWTKFTYLAGGLITSSFFYFSLIFPYGGNLLIGKAGLIFLPNIILFILYMFTPFMIREVVYENKIIKYFIFGPLHYLFDIHCTFFFTWSFWILYKKYKAAAVHIKMQLKYTLLATILGLVLAGIFNMIMPDVFNNYSLIWLGPFGAFCMFSIIAYAIVRYRLMDIKVAVTRTGMFLLLYAFILGTPLYIGYKTGHWIVSTFLAIIFSTIGPFAFRSLYKKTEELLLAEQRRYQTLLLKGVKGIMKERNLDRLLKWIVHVLRRIVGIDYVALFLDDKEGQFFSLRVKEGKEEIPDDMVFSYEHPFVSYMRERKGPFFYEEVPLSIRQSLNMPFEVDIVIPSFIEQSHLGFLLLGEKINREFYSQDDLNVFKILANQAGLAIENAQLYNELRKEAERLKETIKKLNDTQNQLIQTEKMAAIGRLASGIAHELKNPLATVSQGIHFLENNLSTSPDKVAAAIEKMKKSIDRADNIIIDLLKFSGTSDLKLEHLDLCDLLNVSLLLIENRARHSDINIIKDFSEKDLRIQANRNTFQQVLFNLYNNAVDAMPDGGRLTLKAYREAGDVVIEVIDTGIGIPKDNLSRIFDPFFTTKEPGKGVGLGLSIVSLILERHNATINVESEINKGTRFIIRLKGDAKHGR